MFTAILEPVLTYTPQIIGYADIELTRLYHLRIKLYALKIRRY